MRVLTVCREIPSNSAIHNYSIAEFIYEQNKAIKNLGATMDYFLIKKGGLTGYLKETYSFLKYLKGKNYSYDIIHAHGGHIGSLVNIQRKIPVVTTYHGSDINHLINRLISFIALLFSKANIFVSLKIFQKVNKLVKGSIIPCGIDFNVFKPADKVICRKELGLNANDVIILFAGRYDNKIKNYELAKQVIDILNIKNINIIELKDYSREEVNQLLNACDFLLLTSISEGSPQVIKEAMACNCPIISTDVGDIKQIISDTEGCYLTTFDPNDIANKIILALQLDKRTNGREIIKHLNNELIAEKIFEIYKKVKEKQIYDVNRKVL